MKIPPFLLFSLLVLTASGCDWGTSDQAKFDELQRQLEETMKSAQDAFQRLSPGGEDDLQKSAGEEVEKLFTFQYKIFELKRSGTPEQMESELNAAGQEGWECFDTNVEKDLIQFFCKRRPKTYLRYLPKMF